MSIAEVLISRSCYSRFGFAFCICNEVAMATKRRLKGAKGGRKNEGQRGGLFVLFVLSQ